VYCPNCSADLEDKTVDEYWNCHADFSSGSSWKPSTTPAGDFRPFPHQDTEVPASVLPAADSNVSKVVNGIGLVFAFAFFAAVGFLVLLVAVVTIANPCLFCK
jgi:hypothetical protein